MFRVVLPHAVHETNPDGAAQIFMTRDDVRAKFKEAEKLLGKYRMMSSPVYLEFLSGKRELTCTARTRTAGSAGRPTPRRRSAATPSPRPAPVTPRSSPTCA